MMMDLHIVSIDYDGCFDQDGMKRQVALFIKDKLQNSKVEVMLMVGSARQSVAHNMRIQAKNQNGCCYQSLFDFHVQQLEEHPTWIGRLTINPFLLEDMLGVEPVGHHFHQGRSFKGPGGRAAHVSSSRIDWLDEHKIVLLHAQTHQVLSDALFPYQTIHYHFIDDRQDILDRLHEFYQQQPQELPQVHVTLYQGQNYFDDRPSILRLHASIQGQGKTIKPNASSLSDFYYYVVTSEKLAEQQLQWMLIGHRAQSYGLTWTMNLIKKLGWNQTRQFFIGNAIQEEHYEQVLTILVGAALCLNLVAEAQTIRKDSIDPWLKLSSSGLVSNVFELCLQRNETILLDYGLNLLLDEAYRDRRAQSLELLVQYEKIEALLFLLDRFPEDIYYQLPLVPWTVKYQKYSILTRLLERLCTCLDGFIESRPELLIEQAMYLACDFEDQKAIAILCSWIDSPIVFLSSMLKKQQFRSFAYFCESAFESPNLFILLIRNQIEELFPLIIQCIQLNQPHLGTLLLSSFLYLTPSVLRCFKNSFDIKSLSHDIQPKTLNRSRIGLIVSIYTGMGFKTVLMKELEQFYARIQSQIDDPLYLEESNTLYCILKQAEREILDEPSMRVIQYWLIYLLNQAMHAWYKIKPSHLNAQQWVDGYLHYRLIMHGHWFNENLDQNDFSLFMKTKFNQSGIGVEHEYLKIIQACQKNLHQSLLDVSKLIQKFQVQKLNSPAEEDALYRLKILLWRVNPQNRQHLGRLIGYWMLQISVVTGKAHQELFEVQEKKTTLCFFSIRKKSFIEELKAIAQRKHSFEFSRSLLAF